MDSQSKEATEFNQEFVERDAVAVKGMYICKTCGYVHLINVIFSTPQARSNTLAVPRCCSLWPAGLLNHLVLAFNYYID